MKATTIYFEFQTRDETPRIAAPEEYSNGELLGAHTLMDDRDAIEVVIDYPLAHPTTLHMTKPLTVERFARGVAAAYKIIYQEEERTSTKEAGLVPGTLNRGDTDGTYGIVMHGIEDLYLEGASRRSDGKWYLMIGS
jgi:hypothetical protein